MSAVSLFDPEAGKAAKKAGQDQVRKNHPAQTQKVMDALLQVARTHACFTADHVHEELVRQGLRHPDQPNTFGAVFSAAVSEGWITRGSHIQASRRPKAKGRNLVVWDSLVFSGRAG